MCAGKVLVFSVYGINKVSDNKADSRILPLFWNIVVAIINTHFCQGFVARRALGLLNVFCSSNMQLNIFDPLGV